MLHEAHARVARPAPLVVVPSFAFRVMGLLCRVHDFGFRFGLKGLVLRVWGLGCTVKGSGSRAAGSSMRDWGFGVQSVGIRD